MVNYHKVVLEEERESHRQKSSFQQKTVANRRFTMYARRVSTSTARSSAQVRLHSE